MSLRTSPYLSEVLADNPLGFWPLADITNGYTADLKKTTPAQVSTVGVTLIPDGAPLKVSSGAMLFDGANGRLFLGAPAIFRFTTAFTVELWVRFGGIKPIQPLVAFVDANLNGWGVFAAANASNIQFYASGAWNFFSTLAYNDTRDHHIVCTWDGTMAANGVQVWIDGVVVVSGTATAAPVAAPGSLFFADSLYVASGATKYEGRMSLVALYAGKLSATRIAAHLAASKLPADKALMYALGKIARGGATRGGYRSPQTFIAVNGVHVGFGAATATNRALLDSLTVTDVLEQTPNTCAFTVIGFIPTVGQDVVITLGTKNTLTPLFVGKVLRTEQIYLADNPRHVAVRVDAIDSTPLLDRYVVIAVYRNQSATAIALDLIARFAPGFTTRHVQPDLPVLDEVSFTNTPLTDALSQLSKRIGGYYYVDYARDLHLYITEESALVWTPPRPLLATHPTMQHVTLTRDRSQVLTRVLSEGGGANAAGECAPGDTIIPVETGVWYNPAGGRITAGPQRVNYATMFAGGGGSLVGPGATPSGKPNLAALVGFGLTAGFFEYAVSFVTAAGESLVGPHAGITLISPMPPPSSLVSIGALSDGASPDPGLYYWAFSFVTAGGETTPSPTASTTLTNLPPPTVAPLVTDYDDAAGYTNPYYNVGDVLVLQYCYSGQAAANAFSHETTLSPPSAPYTVKAKPAFPGTSMNFSITVYNSTDPRINWIHVWMSVNGGPLGFLTTFWGQVPNDPLHYSTYIPLANGGFPMNPYPGATPSMGGPALNFDVGPSGVTARKLWRTTAGGSQLKLLATIADNTTRDYIDRIKDAALGANAPTVGTAQSAQVNVTGVPLGGTTVTQRKLYRSAVGGGQLKLLTTLADNTTTIYVDSKADAALGANAPTSDTSGLQQPAGQINPGATSLLVAGAAPFRATGGWVFASGGQRIRYTGIAGNALTGIPPSGVGAILAAIIYSSTVTAAPALEGVPATGIGAITITIKQGDPVNLLVQEDDATAQAQLAALIGGDGVIEGYVQDNRLSETEARAKARAYLALRNQVEVSITFSSRDLNNRTGATIDVNLPPPTNIVGAFKIQQVAVSQFQLPHVYPICQVQASSNRFSFEDLLRLARNMTTQA